MKSDAEPQQAPPPEAIEQIVEGLNGLRDSLTEMSLALHDYMFEFEKSSDIERVWAALQDYSRRESRQ